jgi:hypothetical protein
MKRIITVILLAVTLVTSSVAVTQYGMMDTAYAMGDGGAE